MIRALVLAAAIYIALLAQDFIPAVAFMGGARLLIVPLLFCYGALWLPFWGMLVLALYTGLLSDLSQMHVVGDHVEIGLGWTMLFYVFAGTLLQWLREALGGNRWEIHCLSSGVVTLLLLLGQYAMVCFRRESFLFDPAVAWKIFAPPVAALLLAPAAYFLFGLLPGDFFRRAKAMTP